MPIKYVPFIPEPVEGQAVLGNFNRILRYKGADDVSMTLQRGMPLYEMEKQETVGENADGNMVIRGECVSACAYLKEQGIQVDLVYIDPPFASGADYAKKVYIRRNPKVAEAIAQAEQELDVDELKAFEEKMYGDVWDKEKYLNWMYENLMAIKSIMSESASIYVHLDYHIGHYVKILLDEIFGEDNFRNEIIWKRATAHSDAEFYGNNFDCIYFYTKSQIEYVFNTVYQPYDESYIVCLISCPGDIKKEVTLIEAAVDEFNELYAETLGITIKTRHWSKSSYAQSGGKPQALLNEQFVNKCDAAVAIFWTRFGSPTDEYGSGTEEEIEIMLQSGKQVFMYFSDKPIPPSKINGDGYEKIQAFRDKYKDKGIYFTYSSDEEFKKMFFAHLSMHFLAEKRVSETANEYRSELKLLGIDETGRLTEEALVCPFVLNAEITMKEYITSIKNMYQEISDMNVGGRSVTANTFFAGFTSPVDIDEDEKEFITAAAEQLECELSDSFFELGNLNKDTLTSNPLSGPKLNGTSEEKQKYWKIKRLHETISKALEWAPVEKAFSGMNCIKLAIQNCGKAIDEDAEITFEVPKESLLTLGEFPKFNNAEMGYLLTDCDMSILFGIEGTSEYIEYSESEQNGRTPYGARPYGLPGYVPDYSDDFTDEIKDVFCYGFYSSEDKYIVKLKVDYIKHNTTVAFPTILFVKSEIDEIPYKITSKNNPDVVEGCIKVKS